MISNHQQKMSYLETVLTGAQSPVIQWGSTGPLDRFKVTRKVNGTRLHSV